MKRIMVGVMLLGLCACGGGDPVEGGQGQAEPAPATTAGQTSPAAPTGQGSADVSTELCAFLAKEEPRIKDSASRLVGLARFAADYAGWVGEDANRAFSTESEVDSITTSTCPQIRTRVLKALNRDSLAAAV